MQVEFGLYLKNYIDKHKNKKWLFFFTKSLFLYHSSKLLETIIFFKAMEKLKLEITVKGSVTRCSEWWLK